jgi:hypothetical protein
VWHVARPLEELAEDIPKSVRSMIDLTLGRLDDAGAARAAGGRQCKA